MKNISLLVISSLAIFLSDQALKYLLPKNLLTYNKALFFGLITNPFLIGIILVLAISFLSLFAYLHLENRSVLLAIGLIFGGAISNVIDRIFVGAVVDYIPFFISKTNLADIAIICGIGIIGKEYLS